MSARFGNGVVGANAPPAPFQSSNKGLPTKGIALMHKPAPSDFPVHELIRERWSPRAFADKPIPQDVLRSIFEAARWAPSSSNEQPWAYLVATRGDKNSFERMLSVLVEFNANWARSAPVLAIAVAKLTSRRTTPPTATRCTTPARQRLCSPWKPPHAGWPSIRWPALIRKKRARCLGFPQDGNRSPHLPSVTRVTLIPSLNL